jgi:ribosomal protein S12 methylthiotransferase
VQQEISAEINRKKVGTSMQVLIDRKEADYYIGRTAFDSPEVDPEVLIPSTTKGVKVGDFYQAEIVDAAEFDLYGK